MIVAPVAWYADGIAYPAKRLRCFDVPLALRPAEIRDGIFPSGQLHFSAELIGRRRPRSDADRLVSCGYVRSWGAVARKR